MRLLNLCSGTGSVSKPFALAGWEIVDVDWDSTHGPTHNVDIMSWNCPYDAGHFDVAWASPGCTQYPLARAAAKTKNNNTKHLGVLGRRTRWLNDVWN